MLYLHRKLANALYFILGQFSYATYLPHEEGKKNYFEIGDIMKEIRKMRAVATPSNQERM